MFIIVQTLKNDFETQNFEIFDKVVHNFGKPKEVNEKMPISNRCISGLMSNLIKKSWTVSSVEAKGGRWVKNRESVSDIISKFKLKTGVIK